VHRLQFKVRMLWLEHVQQRPIVYLDESGFAVDAPRTHAYAERGKRCNDLCNWHEKGRLNAIGAIHAFKLIAIQFWNCNIDADVFGSWVRHSLLPALPEQSIVVMDNATFHRRTDVLNAIESAGHTFQFLPPYSPDLNPIEKKWAQAKARRRQRRCSPLELFSFDPNYAEL
jgi:transposase